MSPIVPDHGSPEENLRYAALGVMYDLLTRGGLDEYARARLTSLFRHSMRLWEKQGAVPAWDDLLDEIVRGIAEEVAALRQAIAKAETP